MSTREYSALRFASVGCGLRGTRCEMCLCVCVRYDGFVHKDRHWTHTLTHTHTRTLSAGRSAERSPRVHLASRVSSTVDVLARFPRV